MRQEESASGVHYLNLATELLHVARLTDPLQGVWEAADLQWWWRRDQHKDSRTQIFLMDEGQPVAAVVLTDWGGRFQIDLIFSSPQHAVELRQLWPTALGLVESVGDKRVEIEIPSDDEELIQCAVDAGFKGEFENNWACWMPASDQRPNDILPSGFVIRSRAEVTDGPHPMADRNGSDFEERLAECPLYSPDLDLAVYNSDGDVAGYSLYWADRTTQVGLVEPMRTIDAFRGMGIARAMLATGLELLTRSGCQRMKVSAATPLYLGAGFHATTSSYSLAKN